MKEFGSRGGGTSLAPPLRSANGDNISKFTCTLIQKKTSNDDDLEKKRWISLNPISLMTTLNLIHKRSSETMDPIGQFARIPLNFFRMFTPVHLGYHTHDCLQWRIQDFPEGGAPTPGRGQHTIWPIFPENCMKMKKIWPGGARPLRPLRSAMDSQW